MDGRTWIRNPETGGVWECPEGALEMYLARGWEPCDEPPVDDAHLYDPQAPAAEPAQNEPTSKAARRGQTTTKE